MYTSCVYPPSHPVLISSVSRETIWKLRVDFLQERVLSQWESFTIWNAGKQGRKLYRCLSPTNQEKVRYRQLCSQMWITSQIISISYCCIACQWVEVVEKVSFCPSPPFWFIYQVKAFCDVDENKIQKGFYTYEESKVRSTIIVIQCKQGPQAKDELFKLHKIRFKSKGHNRVIPLNQISMKLWPTMICALGLSLSLSLSPDIPPAKTEAKNPSTALQRRLRPFHYLC